jgi:hypothetical protein
MLSVIWNGLLTFLWCLVRFFKGVCGCLLMLCLGCVGRYLDGHFVTWYSSLEYRVGRRRKHNLFMVADLQVCIMVSTIFISSYLL